VSRLSPERVYELFTHALELVAEHGYDKVTMDQIARASRSSKATLYRQWGSKTGLIIAALRCPLPVEEPMPDTGSLRGDLSAVLTQRMSELAESTTLLAALLHAVRLDGELGDAVRDQILTPWGERLDVVVERAVERGEVRADCPALPHLQLLLASPFVLGHVLEGADPDADLMNDYLDAVVMPALVTP